MAFPTQLQNLFRPANPQALQNYGRNIPAPNLAPGTYTGSYAAQGLRTTNPVQAAQLWESRHPDAVGNGNIPPWVSQALMSILSQTGGGQQTQGAPAGHGDIHGFGPGGAVTSAQPSVQHLPEQMGGQGAMNPHALLHEVVNYHRMHNNMPAMHPEELHARVTNLAHEILGSRENRIKQALRHIRPPSPPSTSNPFQAS